ncbi:unnamed protein product [Taenia asiatica]|uniref:YccV-like domain-containing protein n=1 Tax=Taenia asiatica TaxID=60517 RepID=A0A0R3WBP3_TAEAS|nr:unnamed protein product [Taenia asiatica]
MPLLDDDRVHLFIILLLIPLQFLDLFVFPMSLRSTKPTLPPPSPPKIIELHERNHVFFGASQRVHHTRPPSLQFSIGQVVRHRLGFKAVVIGWDEVACRTLTPLLSFLTQQPNYRLLADSKDTLFQLGPVYAAQDELKALSAEELKSESRGLHPHEPIIKHAIISEFFDFFDGKKFSPRPWLRRIYPQG